jgi:hypothetical protein
MFWTTSSNKKEIDKGGLNFKYKEGGKTKKLKIKSSTQTHCSYGE